MREIQCAYNTVDNKKFEEAKEAFYRLENFFNDFNEKHIKFGYELYAFQKNKFYALIKPKDEKHFFCVYKSMAEFAEAELFLKKRTVANYIAVAKNFADKQGNVLPKYKGYGYTQLVVMLQTLKMSPNYRELFTPNIRVEDMKLLVKGIRKGAYNFLLSLEENIIHIADLIEAEKAGRAAEVLKNIEAVEEKYKKADRVDENGELIPGEKDELHLNAISDKKSMKKALKGLFREKDYSFFAGGKSVGADSVVENIIKLLTKNEGV